MSTSVRDREQRVAGNEGESVPLLSSDALLVEENGLAASVQKRRGVCFRWTLGSLAASLLVGLLLATFLSRKRPPPTPYGTLRSNGTHLFNTTVIMVSIDGLRADYLDRGFTPHLFEISQIGLRAKYMKPIFPTVTFPNHWSLLTGLHAESHGVVGNEFWDPQMKKQFMYSDPKRSWDASWWHGEPIWELLEKNGIRTANLMWIGPPITTRGIKPFYFKPWRNRVSLKEKLDQVLNWIDLPLDQRPQLVLAYEPSLDQAGHSEGPLSALVNATLKEIDIFAKDLHTSLAERNLSDIVDVVFVSDHGMADTSHVEWVYLEDFIGDEGCNDIAHQDGWPSMGLRFINASNTKKYLGQLEAGAAKFPDKFEVYSPETMPERYHFSNNIRISPVYVIPKRGYALSKRRGPKEFYSHGNHGFDNEDPAMRAIFVADGPFSQEVKQKRALVSRGKSWVIEGFPNVELKGLLARLFGVPLAASSHNGTEGFWDQYFTP